MEFSIDTNNVLLEQQNQVESGEYNVTECNFIFSSEYEDLTKKAVFTGEDGIAYLQTIVNNKCSIPSEILATSQVVQIGVYAYAVENEELILRYSPEPTDFFIHEGSYKEAQNSTPPTPSEIEQLQSQITTNANNIGEIQSDVVDINTDITNIKTEQTEQNANIQNNTDDITELQNTKADKSEIPTKTSDLINDSDFVVDNNYVHTDNNFTNEDKGQIKTNKDDISTINGNIQNINTSINDINQNIDDLEQDLTNYSLITETGSQIELNINSSDFKFKAILKDKNGNTIYTSNIIDLPLETMVVGASYDNVTKEVVLTLQNGTTLRFSVADLVSGLVSTDELTQILSNYYNKTEVNNLLANHYTKSETDTLLDEKANQTSLDATNQNVTNLTGRVSTNEEDIANIKEEQTTQNTNIEELQNQVETLQEDLDNAEAEIAELNTDITNMAKAMYKVDGQGSDITLPNTSENKLVEFGLEGRTEQDGEPTPETPIPIKNVTGNANVKIQNKNLLNIDREIVSAVASNFDITDTTKAYNSMTRTGLTSYGRTTVTKIENGFKISGQPYWGLAFPCKLKTGQTYTIAMKATSDISIGIGYYDNNKEYIANNVANSKICTFTVPSNIYITNIVLCPLNENVEIDITNIIMVEGSYTAQTIPEYVPHKEQNYPFTFAEGQFLADDENLQDNGMYKKWKKKIFDGTESWFAQVFSGGVYYYTKIADGSGLTALCSHFINIDSSIAYSIPVNQFAYSGNTTKNILFNNGDTENKLTDWKAWLAQQYANGTPVIVEYELAESELENNIIPYNATQQAQYDAIKEATSEDDITIISSESDELGFDMNVVAVADANKVIDKELQEIKSAVIALGGDLNV